MSNKKYFTLSEARQLLPTIKEELIQLQKLQTEFEEKYLELRTLESEESKFELECKLEFLEMEAQLHVNNIHNQGVQLKDIDHGLIDFPALIDGEEVLLCWKQGEDDIEYYHGLHDGFMGRKKIDSHDV